jgi:DNA-directed RNA polymerase subunit H
MSEFNVLMHEMVPEHHLIPEGEEQEVLKKLKLTKEQLPKIRKSDPVIATLEEILGEIREGRIIKIVRKSPTSGLSTAYRLVSQS